MDKNKARLMRDKLATVLKDFEKEFGVETIIGNATYGASHINFKVEFAEARNGEVQSKAARAYMTMASYYELPADGLNREFTVQGNTYRVVGLNTRRSKFPVEVVRRDGRHFKMCADTVKVALRLTASPTGNS